ncbi:MAG: type IV pilin [Methanoregula sp.]|nr:type IV pilin [Methanoregula sp.]
MNRKTRDAGVSPVVGVMLMLVVVIIIAAVVSAFAGGMAKTTDKAPTASLEVHIANDGTWGGSGFDLAVKGASASIPTKDIKIITDWKAANGASGGATVTGPGVTGNTVTNMGTKVYHHPMGFGPGVQAWNSSGVFPPDMMFGNYTLVAGTRMHTSAFGSMDPNAALKGGYGVSPGMRFIYTNGTAWDGNDRDGMMAILGNNWNATRAGDVVHMKVLHVPTGKVLYDGKITVEG